VPASLQGMADKLHQAAAPPRCEVCQRPIEQPRRGRRRRYCTTACRQVAYRTRQGQAHRRKLVALVQADARDLLAALPAESVDLIITDPPYHLERGGDYFRTWFPELPDEAWPEILSHLQRVLREDRHCYLFCDRRTQPLFDEAARDAGFRVHPPLIWNKGSIGLGGGCWRPQHELIGFYEKGHRSGQYRSEGDVLTHSRVARGYPTEKPIPVLERIIRQASWPGELILDPFCGSGNVGQAGRNLGRRTLLADIEPACAARRLRLATARLSDAVA
jgi:site-specific DNA-methyltransferase (adenine-specific)